MPTPRKAISNQKGRKSARQKEAASTAPVPLGKPIKTMPAEVAADKVAAAKWGSIAAAYKEAGYVPTLGDAEAIARLCLLYSEAEMIRRRAAKDGDDFLECHKLLDSKRRLILSLEDRLYLNPVARMRGLPTPKVDDTPSAAKKFNV